MRITKRMKRAFAALLCLCILAQSAPLAVFAADGLCHHHPEHTAECGYEVGQEAVPCDHVHSEGCYEIVSCAHTCDDSCSDPCTHECTQDSGCVTLAPECSHVHGDCGYVPAVEASPCQYVCTECGNDGTDESGESGKSDETTASTEAPVCTCEAEEGEPHAPFCALYEKPENPQCHCVEKCGAETVNEWCDICYWDHTICTGEDTLVTYASDGYIEISTPEQLSNIRNDLTANYRLTKDIDLTASLAEDGELYNVSGWLAIGWNNSGSKAFTGTLDGNGYTISGFSCKGEESNYLHMAHFIHTNKGTIKNLTISGNSNVGGVFCHINEGRIENCHNKVEITASIRTNSENYYGGLVNQNSAGGIVEFCSNTAKIAGSVYPPLSGGSGQKSLNIGGIAGLNMGKIQKCYNTGSLSCQGGGYTSAYAGGIVGYSKGAPALIENCYNCGTIYAKTVKASSFSYNVAAGGILATGYGDSVSTIQYCYNAGNVSLSNDGNSMSLGSLVGYPGKNPVLNNCYFLDGTCQYAVKNQNSYSGVTRLNSTQMKNQTNFNGFDFTKVWSMGTGSYPYPVLRMDCRHAVTQVEYRSATCQEEGNIEYWWCASCGKYYDSETKDKEITKASTVISKGHYDWDSIWVSVENEVHTQAELKPEIAAHYHCTLCGKYFDIEEKETTLDALTGETPKHIYGDWINTDKTKHWKTCTTCELVGHEGLHSFDKEVERVPAVGETPGHVTMQCICGAEKTDPLNHVHSLAYEAFDSDSDSIHDSIRETCAAGCSHDKTITLKVPINAMYDGKKKEARVEGDIDGEFQVSYNREPINADTYTATLSVGDVSVPLTYTIASAPQASPADVTGVGETIRGRNDGKITGVDTTMEYRKEGQTTYTSITATELTNLAPGTYYVRYPEKVNYSASPDVKIPITQGRMLQIYLPADQLGYTLAVTDNGSTEVTYGGSITLTYYLVPGYTQGKNFTVTATSGTVTHNGDGIYTISGITTDTTVSVTDVSDITAPQAEIAVTAKKWAGFLNTITFNLFFKQDQQVTITATDTGSGVTSIVYALSDTAKTLEEVKLLTDWSTYTAPFSMDAERKYIVYAKVTDGAGNTLYLSSDGMVIDKTLPLITGVVSGKTYYTTQKVTATDTNLDTMTCNGNIFDGLLPGNLETSYTIAATDKADNRTELSITMRPISTLREAMPTDATVKLKDEDALQALKMQVSDILANQCANATATEKQALTEITVDCDDLLEKIHQAKQVIALIDTMPDEAKVSPDNKEAIDKYDDAQAAYSSKTLPAASKRMVDERNADRLEAMRKALTAYDITAQSASYYIKGSGKTLTFTANGYYAEYGSYTEKAWGKFVDIEVDGKTLDAKHYTVKAGSTVITLKNSYLETLSNGKHTLQVNYTDGSTDGKDTFRVSTDNGNPRTGDPTIFILLTLLTLGSLMALILALKCTSRKKGRYQS